MTKYWLVQVDFEYLVNSYLEYTTLKTEAGRLRDKHLAEVKELLNEYGFTSVSFVPTTYKPSGTEFIHPTTLSWMCEADRKHER